MIDETLLQVQEEEESLRIPTFNFEEKE